jgi:hypothetical protein
VKTNVKKFNDYVKESNMNDDDIDETPEDMDDLNSYGEEYEADGIEEEFKRRINEVIDEFEDTLEDEWLDLLNDVIADRCSGGVGPRH